jgi:T-complex protein 1 subunit delta
MLVELSKAQDIEAGDGTTSVCVLAGSLLDAADKLLKKGIHPTSISESFQRAAAKSVEILTAMATPVDLSDKESLLKASNTSLNSKVVSQNSAELSPIAVDAVLKIIDPSKENNVNLKDIKIIKKIGGTVDDTELIDGMVFEQKESREGQDWLYPVLRFTSQDRHGQSGCGV